MILSEQKCKFSQIKFKQHVKIKILEVVIPQINYKQYQCLKKSEKSDMKTTIPMCT